MSEKVKTVGVTKERGYLYFLDKDGDVARSKMSRTRKKGTTTPPEKVAKVGVEKETGYLYFIDKDGDVGRAKMQRGRDKK